MKPLYVVFLMGAAALGGGLVVRYTEHPVEITLNRAIPPPVVAPPIPPTAHVGPSTSVPVRSALPETPAAESVAPEKAEKPAPPKPEKPSAFSAPVHVSKPEPAPPEPRPTARVRIPPEPPAVIPLERTSAPPDTPRSTTHSQEPAGILRDPDASTLTASAKPSPAPAHPSSSSAPPSAPPSAVPPVEGNHATLKAGMLISVRITDALSSNTNSAGDVFSGILERPLIADGFVIAERGARVRGEVVDSKSAGRESELTIRLREILASDGQRVHIVSNPWRKVSTGNDARPRSVYDVPLTRESAAVIRPATNVTFRLDQPVALTEKR